MNSQGTTKNVKTFLVRGRTPLQRNRDKAAESGCFLFKKEKKGSNLVILRPGSEGKWKHTPSSQRGKRREEHT